MVTKYCEAVQGGTYGQTTDVQYVCSLAYVTAIVVALSFGDLKQALDCGPYHFLPHLSGGCLIQKHTSCDYTCTIRVRISSASFIRFDIVAFPMTWKLGESYDFQAHRRRGCFIQKRPSSVVPNLLISHVGVMVQDCLADLHPPPPNTHTHTHTHTHTIYP